MKKFFKAIGVVLAFFGAAIGALAIFDKYQNRNKPEGDYLECTVPAEDEE